MRPVFWLRVHRDIWMGRPVMAAARDQAARIVRAGPEAAEERSCARRLADAAARPGADSRRGRSRRAAEPPGAPEPNRPGAPPAGAADAAAAKPGKRKFVMIGVARAAGARRDRLRRLLRPGRALLCLDRRRLCSRQQHHARRPGVGPCRGDPARATIRSFAPAT